MNELLIDRLKKARMEKGLKQQDVAEKLGLKANTISNWEKGRTEPDIDTFIKLCDIYNIDCAALLADVYAFKRVGSDLSLAEYDHIKKYRDLDDPGRETVDIIIDRESQRVDQLRDFSDRIADLENKAASIIEIQDYYNPSKRLVKYYRGASAGEGVFILGNEVTDEILIPDTPETKKVDYVIKISGQSMEPDYFDGDNVMVSQDMEMCYGDVGIFVVDGNAYIKEYGKAELISRNPNFDNIPVSEYANIVCMGKVIGKLDEPIEVAMS